MKTIKISLLLLLFGCLISCGRLDLNSGLDSYRPGNSLIFDSSQSNLAEVAAPKIIKQLNQDLEQYVPQVKIISPKPEQTFNRTEVAIELDVRDLPIFQDDKLKLGNHLNLVIDNEPSQEIYSTQQPIVVTGLAPGTHSIRVFAARPWGESYKNEGAYAQTNFNVLTETNDNRLDSHLPLLTYNSPTGTYGAEPLLLDFYLTNAPLHAIAQNDPNLSDWRIRATVDGTSFTLSDWQPIYLTGFKPGENWVQLELIDRAGNTIENSFNNTVRVITFNPQQQDTIARLMTDNIPLPQAQAIVNQNYYTQPDETFETIEPRDITEPEIELEIPRQAIDNAVDNPDNLAEPKLTLQDEDETNSPTVPKTSISQTGQIEQPKTTEIKQAEIESLEASRPKQEIEIEIAPDSKSLNSRSSQTKLNSQLNPQIIADVQSGQPVGEISINRPNSDPREPTVTIVMPEPELVEIGESEIAVTVSQAELDNYSTPKQAKSLWWKKILAGLRQKIEALAKLLPNEV